MKVVAGVDAGSTALKVTLYDGRQMLSQLGPAGWNPRAACAELVRKTAAEWELLPTELSYIIGTGYGRVGLDFLQKAVTEITCHGRGAAYLCPDAVTVIDIGGQDAKAMRIDQFGKVQEFLMNDKCAAGTGRFLQIMVNALGLDVADLDDSVLAAGEEACKINAMCTVFAESEVIGLLHQGHSRGAVLAGLLQAIASRVGNMAARIYPAGKVVFTGGLARSERLRQALEKVLALPVQAPPDAVFAGSIGAALLAWEQTGK